MTIRIYPEEIVKLCLWDTYVSYIVGSNKEAEKILEANEEMEISHKDALVIGLLKVIETNNLIHKFNNYIMEYLANKTVRGDDLLLVRKRGFDIAIDKFLTKFPEYWKPSKMWSEALEELYIYVENMKEKLEELEVHTMVERNMTFELYNSNHVKKMLKFQY